MYAWCQDMPGVSADDYAEVVAELGGAATEQPGLVSHVAGSVPGGFRIIDVWESREDARRFQQQHLAPAVERAHGERGAELRAGFQLYDVEA